MFSLFSKVLKLLHQQGANLSQMDFYNRSPLYMVATDYFDGDVFKYLVEEAQVDLNQADLGGNTILDKAKRFIRGGDPDKLLEERNASGESALGQLHLQIM